MKETTKRAIRDYLGLLVALFGIAAAFASCMILAYALWALFRP